MTNDAFAQPTDDQDPGNQGGNDDTENSQDTSNTDPNQTRLASILNEDGTPKYADVAAALDSIPHAAQHITTIEGDNALLKEQLATANAAKDLLAKQVGNKEPAQNPGLTAEEVAAIVKQQNAADTQASVEAANVATVNAKFSELYGEKANVQMLDIAQKSGMTVDAIKTLAKSSPQAVLRLAGITSESKAPVTPKSPGSGFGDSMTPNRKPEAPKSVMGGSDTKSMIDNWRAAGEIVKNQTQ